MLATDTISGKQYEIKAKVVINATGVFSDSIQQMDDADKPASISPSQGIHVVLDKEFLPGDAAIMIPHTDDGRVLFAVPWHNKIIIGTTDTLVENITEEPLAQKEEIDFILHHAARYLTKDPTLNDVRSIFAGLRPLVKSNTKKTAEISRDHSIIISDSGLISIVGGKWTTYRKMSEDVVNTAAIHAGLPYKECITTELPVHGNMSTPDFATPGYYYGTDKKSIDALVRENNSLAEPIHTKLPYTKADITWSVREEAGLTIEDILARRTRALLLDAKAAIEASPVVASIMAKELNQTEAWIKNQIISFTKTAKNYLP